MRASPHRDSDWYSEREAKEDHVLLVLVSHTSLYWTPIFITIPLVHLLLTTVTQQPPLFLYTYLPDQYNHLLVHLFPMQIGEPFISSHSFHFVLWLYPSSLFQYQINTWVTLQRSLRPGDIIPAVLQHFYNSCNLGGIAPPVQRCPFVFIALMLMYAWCFLMSFLSLTPINLFC